MLISKIALRVFSVLIFFTIVAILTSSTTSKSSAVKYELTSSALHEIKDFDAAKISVFGVAPGMLSEEVEAAIASYDFLFLQDDKYNRDRIYLYDDLGNCLAYFIWKKGDPTLNEIVLYDEISMYFKSIQSEIFSKEVFNPQSEYAKVLGKPDRSEITLNVEMIHLLQVSYFYNSKHLEIIRQQYNQKEEFMLVLHEV